MVSFYPSSLSFIQAKPGYVVQKKGLPDQDFEISAETEDRINAVQGGGQSLSESMRSFMESRFGADFSQVRAFMPTEGVSQRASDKHGLLHQLYLLINPRTNLHLCSSAASVIQLQHKKGRDFCVSPFS